MQPPTHKERDTSTAASYGRIVLLAFAIVCKAIVIAQLWKRMPARITSEELLANSPPMWPAEPAGPVHLAFEDSIHYGLDTPVSDTEWSSLAPNDGLVYLGDEDEIFSISMFHELRCLNIIRKGVMRTVEGNVTTSTHLIQHCLNYIRQMIFCRSNTMLTGFVQSTDADKPHSFLGIQRCNDWAEIYKELERNQEDHRTRLEGVETREKS